MRAVIADDSAIVRDGLNHLLNAHGIDVVATAADPDNLIAAVHEKLPDLAIIDIRMPPTHTNEGLLAAATIRKTTPQVAVLVLSQHIEAEYAMTLLRDTPSRSGYLLKDRVTDTPTLLDAINRVTDGQTVIDPSLIELLLERATARKLLDDLTEREQTVLALVAEGLTDQAIGERLWLSRKTVETHVRHILAKLELPPDEHSNRRVLATITYLRS
jgi:DNA-binding NarL/FixJ family response regulator